MSYYKVSYISDKNQTLRLASNNVFPLDWFTAKPFKEKVSDKEFTSYIIDNILDGNFHVYGQNNKYNILAEKIRDSEAYRYIYKMRDDNYDKHLDIEFKHNAYKDITDEEQKSLLEQQHNEYKQIEQTRIDIINSFIQ